jgi:hypothetical protein
MGVYPDDDRAAVGDRKEVRPACDRGEVFVHVWTAPGRRRWRSAGHRNPRRRRRRSCRRPPPRLTQCNTPCMALASPAPHTQSRPGQGSVQHPGQDCGVPTRSHSRLNAQCKHVRKVSGWPNRCKSAHAFP